MTTHDDLTDIEARLRSSLRERAEDVDTTPALYERVQRQANRAAWLRRGLAVVGAVAVVAAAVVVVPPLLPEPELDIADTPEDAQPSVAPSEPGEPSPGTLFADPLLEADVAFADANGVVNVGERAVTSPSPVVSLAVGPSWTEAEGAVAAGLEDGRIGIVDLPPGSGDRFDLLVEAAANGGGVGFSPDGQAIAWIEGTDLHVLPLASAAGGERVLPLEGDVPEDLVFEQWFAAADAQLVLASDPAGGVWRIPMDDSDPFDSAPTEPASLLPDAADAEVVDAALLSDLSLVVLRVPADGAVPTLTIDGNSFPVEEVTAADAELAVTGGDATVFDPTTGVGTRRSIEVDGFDVIAQWEAPGVTAVAPLPSDLDGGVDADTGGPDADADDPDPATEEAADLGLPTDAPVIGTAGTDLLVRTADGEVQTIAVYPAGSEATLGRLAVRPGSTLRNGLVAVESFSEGENSIRFVQLRRGEATPVGDILITDGPVTGLLWSEGGEEIAFSDLAGAWAARVTADVVVLGGAATFITPDAAPIVDWVWTEIDGERARGYLTHALPDDAGVRTTGVERAPDAGQQLRLDPDPAFGGSDRVILDTHANPGAAVGPEVHAALGGGTATLQWVADGDRSGELPDPGLLGGDVRVQVSGGQVLVMGDSRQVLVTFDGQVTELPTAADWDVLD